MSDAHDNGMRTLLTKRAAAGQPVAFLKDGQRWELPADGELTEMLVKHAADMGVVADVEPEADDRLMPVGKVDRGAGGKKRRRRIREANGVGKIGPDDGASLAKAQAEIEEHRAAIKAAGLEGDQHMRTDNIIADISTRIADIRKAQPDLTEGAAMLKLAESRNPEDQALWREYKTGIAPAGAVAKEFDADKAIRKMVKRCEELMAVNPAIRSRESAIAKVAASTLSADQALWARYKHAGQVAPAAALPHSDPAPVGKAAHPADEQLIAAIMRRLGCSRERAARLALEVRSAV